METYRIAMQWTMDGKHEKMAHREQFLHVLLI